MSYRRNTTTTRAHAPPTAQRSYVVSIDAGAFANVEIVVRGHHRGGVCTPSRTATVTVTGNRNNYAYGARPASPPAVCTYRDG